MKSKKAQEYINTHPLFMAKIFAKNAVELAEQEAEKELTHYKTALEESKQRKELAQKIITDKRSEIEALKARAVVVFRDTVSGEFPESVHKSMETEFIQKLNEQ